MVENIWLTAWDEITLLVGVITLFINGSEARLIGLLSCEILHHSQRRKRAYLGVEFHGLERSSLGGGFLM